MQRSQRGVGDTKLEDESNYGNLTWGGTESQENETVETFRVCLACIFFYSHLQFLSVVIFSAQRT